MKKRYGLDSIIGKKSALRFPRLVYHIKTDTVSAILPANNSLPEAPFSTTVTMKKGDSLDICDHFNDSSYDYELDFPIRINVTLSGPVTNTEVLTPSIFSLMNITYNLEDSLIEKFRASILDISTNQANFALIKLNTEDDFFMSELLSNIKSIYSNLLSYNCRRKANKGASALLIKIRKRRFLSTNNLVQVPANQQYNHRRYLHFITKTKRLKKIGRLPYQLDRIHLFYDLLEDWDEFYDQYHLDLYLRNLDTLVLYGSSSVCFIELQENPMSFQSIYHNKVSPLILSSFDSDDQFGSSLSLTFNLEP